MKFAWTRWSLARTLPLLTAAIVVVVVTLSLTVTYGALRQARTESMHDRLEALARQIAASSEQSTRTRALTVRQVAADTVIQHALFSSVGPPGSRGATHLDTTALAATLAHVMAPADSGLPVELLSVDGQRVAHLGASVPGDPLASASGERRSASDALHSRAPLDARNNPSVANGALYAVGGQVYYWTTTPVLSGGRRIGQIVQQRRIYNGPTAMQTIRALIGEDMRLLLRNRTDSFWASIEGRPVAPPVRDTADGAFFARHGTEPRQMASEAAVAGTPWMVVLEAPEHSVLTSVRATLRRIALLSLLVLVPGIVAAWLLGRQIVRPLVTLTTAAEDIAAGDYARRVPDDDEAAEEVRRMRTSFNRMAGEVQASQRDRAAQVRAAQTTADALAQTNAQLAQASLEAAEARDSAQHANRAKSDFLAVMSHELRTPLNAIGGYAEILTLGIYGSVSEKQLDALRRITRSQQTLLTLINDVLNFAKLEAGEVRYTITDVPLVDALVGMEAMIAPQLRDRELTYTVQSCGDRATVRADRDKLQQIVLNLLSNAIKFTPKGGFIALGCEMTENVVRIDVRDSGIGIAPERVRTIFDPFVQAGRALNRPHDGVGLGLSISRDLATAMSGALSVESVVDEGSTFTLTLPAGRPLSGLD